MEPHWPRGHRLSGEDGDDGILSDFHDYLTGSHGYRPSGRQNTPSIADSKSDLDFEVYSKRESAYFDQSRSGTTKSSQKKFTASHWNTNETLGYFLGKDKSIAAPRRSRQSRGSLDHMRNYEFHYGDGDPRSSISLHSPRSNTLPRRKINRRNTKIRQQSTERCTQHTMPLANLEAPDDDAYLAEIFCANPKSYVSGSPDDKSGNHNALGSDFEHVDHDNIEAFIKWADHASDAYGSVVHQEVSIDMKDSLEARLCHGRESLEGNVEKEAPGPENDQ